MLFVSAPGWNGDGALAEAIRHELRAAELDPRDWNPRDEAITTYILVRDYTAAEGLADRAIADFPERADYFRAIKAEAAFSAGDLKAARASLLRLSAPEADFHWQLLEYGSCGNATTRKQNAF